MGETIENLRQMFLDGKITKQQLLNRVNSGIMSIEEYEYIIGLGGDRLSIPHV